MTKIIWTAQAERKKSRSVPKALPPYVIFQDSIARRNGDSLSNTKEETRHKMLWRRYGKKSLKFGAPFP